MRARPGAAAGARGPRSRPPGRDAASRTHRDRRTIARVAPHAAPDGRTRHRTRRPHGRIARFEALLPPRVRSRGLRPPSRSLRPFPSNDAGPMLSWDYALLEPSPPCPRVRSIARMPGEPDTPGRPRPAPVVERSASILRPRPSGPDGCARLAGRSTPTADVAHVRAPSRRRPCLSCPYTAWLRRIAAARGAGLQRSEGYGGGSVSERPTSSSRVLRLLDGRGGERTAQRWLIGRVDLSCEKPPLVHFASGATPRHRSASTLFAPFATRDRAPPALRPKVPGPSRRQIGRAHV